MVICAHVKSYRSNAWRGSEPQINAMAQQQCSESSGALPLRRGVEIIGSAIALLTNGNYMIGVAALEGVCYAIMIMKRDFIIVRTAGRL